MKRAASFRSARSAALPAAVAAVLLTGLAGPGATAAEGATSPGVITTVAGGAGRGLARNISQSPSAVTTGPGGVVYEGDSDDGGGVVREFTSQSSLEKVIAGVAGSAPGYAIRSGPAGQARLASVTGLMLDHAGNLLISDGGNGLVRVLARISGTFYGQPIVAGDIYTIAGGGGFGTDSGEPATLDGLDFPQGLAVDGSGNVVIADSFHDMIRVVAVQSGTFYGQAMTAGDIYNIAGTGTGGYSGDGGRPQRS